MGTFAYRFMNEKKDMEAAGKLFRLNMEEYPKSANELKKLSDKELDWVIFKKTDNEEWQRVYAMNMKK